MHLVQSMAYVGAVPWHGLGQRLAPNQPLEVWAQQAGMDWRIESADVQFDADGAYRCAIHTYPEQKVLYRSDTKAPLSVVSRRYKVVQPAEILEFYRDLTEIGGFELETAGVLKEGRKLWALARTGHSVTLRGGDTVNGYLLLATACDGTLATMAQFTSVRVVCNNTLAIAINNGANAIKVPHHRRFDAQAVKKQLGVATTPWSDFAYYIKALADRPMAEAEVSRFLENIFAQPINDTPKPPGLAINVFASKKVRELYAGQGRGAGLASANGTAWGLLNGVTEYIDHHRRAQGADYRRDAAWFGLGAALKQRAWDEASRLIA
ncbi:DUF932 domain-containing protein [Dyella sp. GSA-30]|uniref:DUF932 domain-containing protein n=1 Tax=Dyella sp. GSA-30 TaxID=2994496 RepID=UPI002491D4B6|nr:DUF932 domain-containing protein [Dyella sp. GSA-30]BDU22243.1 hypothetical protein DYGSA30_37000 [Dyella sp. GSA-30]